jgi:hypothetical protein
MSNVHLILSTGKPWDAIYRTSEGQVIYKVESAMPSLGRRDIKITKVIPSFLNNQVTTNDDEQQQLKDTFGHLATVEFHTTQSSRIRMGDLDVATNVYFQKERRSASAKLKLVLRF